MARRVSARGVPARVVGGRGRTWTGSVYAVVRMIPAGKVATYGQIAALLGRARGGREVGWALSSCDDPRVPCHRVVDRNGRLAPHFREQRARLRKERVAFKGSGVDLEESAWRPSTRALLAIGRVIESR